jgi:curli biogenesis system outer membrane secretion channel CsgG|nr:hypothetical protein [uncultured Oscillibacter sp.]
MRIKEWIFVLAITGLGMMTANFIGFDVAFLESLPGVLVLLGIALCAAGLSAVIPLKLPTVAYCSILGLLCACPISPISTFVIESAGKINFTAPLTMVGAFAGMSISNQLKTFLKQGWKLILITILVMTGTFFGSLIIAQVVLRLTNAI